MRILHLSKHCQFANGNVHAAVDLACEQASQGHTVAFGSSGGYFEPLMQKNGVGLIHVPQENITVPKAIRTFFSLWKAIRDFRPDVIHAHMMTCAVLAKPLTLLYRIPLVTTVHNSFDGHAILMGLGNRVIGVSHAVSEEMIRRRIPRSRVRTVLNGTRNTVRRKEWKDQNLDLARPNLISIGGLHPRKGISTLLDAFEIIWRSHPEATLNILGEGPFKEQYEAQAAALKSGGNIMFRGALHDTGSWLNASDIFVLPSLREPFGLVICEAREAGCAIVATDVDGVPEVCHVGNAGLLVPPEDAPALAKAVISLLDNPELLAQQKAASLRDIEFFDISRVCHQTLDVYREVTRKRP